MRKQIRSIAVSGPALIACLCVAACRGGPPCETDARACATATWGEVDPALASRLQAALEAARAEQDLPGLAMAVAFPRSRQRWVSAVGFSKLDTQTPWQPGDQSRIGSVTKTFTGALVMQLAEEGKLSLDDTIERWVPGGYSGPTLRHLLAHRSGIASYNYVGNFDKTRAWTPEQLVQWAHDHEPNLKFAPGSQWEYSNTNFVLLGLVIEKVTGQAYADVLKARLFEPLGLGSMRLALSGDDDPRLVRCYDGSPPVDSSLSEDPSVGWAAGAIVTSPADLVWWISALYGGGLLSKSSLEQMTTVSGETPSMQDPFGLATFVIEGDGHSQFGHTGGIAGYMTYAYYLEPEDVALVVMSNRRPADVKAAATHGWTALLAR